MNRALNVLTGILVALSGASVALYVEDGKYAFASLWAVVGILNLIAIAMRTES
jgi:hypothetical protein